MTDASFHGGHFRRMFSSGDGLGASCDENGPALGPVRLLVKTSNGFAPRPVEELNDIFAFAFGRPCDCSDLVDRLQSVLRALNAGHLAQAVFATQYLHLPPLTEEEAARAARAQALSKASPDDPQHPGWPKGTEGGKGGQFRPKDGTEEGRDLMAAERKIEIEGRLARTGRRRIIRSILRRMLNLRQVARLTGEGLSQAAPILDAIGDAALVHDIVEMTNDARKLKYETAAATAFIDKGPYNLDQLRVSQDDESFSSINEFKKIDLGKRFGPAGDGMEYHHIVEQNASGDIPEEELQSTRNIVRIPKLLHEEITADYLKSNDDFDGSLRRRLEGRSFEERWNEGLRVMREIGIIN
jgi:hypothetical protein